MEAQELIEALKSVNINSESAEAITREYFRFQYIKMAYEAASVCAIIGLTVYAVRAFWKHAKKDF